MSKSIKLDPVYGLNSSISKCFICGTDTGIIMCGDMKGKEAPKYSTQPGHFCEDCESHLKNDVMFLIEIRDGDTSDDPYRTGKILSILRTSFQKIGGNDLPVMYIEQSALRKILGDNYDKEI